VLAVQRIYFPRRRYHLVRQTAGPFGVRARPRVAFGAARCGPTSRCLEVVGHFDQIGLEGENQDSPGTVLIFTEGNEGNEGRN
jgi:hypothetical protein